MSLDILVVDDERDIRELVAGVLEDEGYATRGAADSDAALEAIADRRPSLVLLDVWLQGSRLDGLDLLDEIKRRDSSIPVLVISGHGNLDTAVAAIRRGAADFIEKPFEAERLLLMVARATETERLRREVASLRASVGRETDLTGASGSINSVRATLKRVASTGSRVMITGGPGVGKEVAARLLHGWSQRTNAPFVIVSAARMTPERVEEELFGVEEGGDLVRPGLLEQAHGGTLFLDEIADMPVATQARILRVLTDQSFSRVGGTRIVRVDVRVVSATARDLMHEIAEGRFREDLYYRLNVVPVNIPPLTERREDIPVLVEHFVAHYANERRVPLSEEEYVSADDFETRNFAPSEIDRQILQDKDPNYRVFNLAGNTYNETRTSAYHKSVGGYHPAKLRIYQDVIERYLSGRPDPGVMNMLNTKYVIIQDPQTKQPTVIRNDEAFGHAWFVKNVSTVPDKANALLALGRTNLKDTAVVEQGLSTAIVQPQWDSAATIRMTSYDPDQILYETDAATPQFAVFSEIYYPKGWNAYIDDKKVEYANVNYLLRGLSIPAGKHTVKFVFEPESFKSGVRIMYISSFIILIVLIGGLVMEWRTRRKPAA